MAKTAKVTITAAQTDGKTLSDVKEYTGSISKSLEESVADSVTDGLVAFTLDISACKFLLITSDQDVILETNDGGTPIDTINLLANVPFLWTVDSYYVNLIGTDITALFFTNSSGSTANIKIESLEDATP